MSARNLTRSVPGDAPFPASAPRFSPKSAPGDRRYDTSELIP
ncbi:hypothetical protein OG897_06660 [Streptomyces sp. NBC_00237]|nr:hypothetical protein [Streptomyces sp. NBC_00237]MCX5201141.1 hypothetical protein [Streptomyces sp. NBC_00237]